LIGIGETLRQARSSLGVDLEQAADATNIRARYLGDLEEERFDRLPAAVYTRSFLREYAEWLGLDGDLLLAWYEQTHRELARPELVPRSTAPRPHRGVPGSRAAVGAVAIGLGALLLWALGQNGSAPNPLGNLEGQPAPVTHAAPAVGNLPHTARPTRSSVAILTAARGDCWLAARIGSREGPTAYEGFLRRGHTLRLGLGRTLWLRLRAPWNVDVQVAGKAAELSTGSRPVNVLVSRDGLRTTT